MKLYKPTVSQKLIWLDQLIDKGSSKYNIGGYAFLEGELNYGHFSAAIRTVLRSQEVYASRFMEIEGELVAYTATSFDAYDIAHIDFSAAADPRGAAMEWMEQDFALPFDIGAGPLFTFKLLKINEGIHFWYAKIHHIIGDGWSFKLLLNQAAEIYSTLAEGKEYAFQELRYSDYALDDEGYYQSADMEKDRSFWLNEFSAVPDGLFRKIAPGADNNEPHAGSHTLFISEEIKQSLQAFAEARKSSLFQLVTALLLAYFSRTRQQDEICIAVPVLNRTKKAYRSVAGVFMNLMPLKFRVSHTHTLADVLGTVKQKMSAVLRHQRYQYGNLVKDLKIPVGKTLYDIRISYEDFEFTSTFGSLKTGAVALSNHGERDKLAIYLRDYNHQGFDIRFVYDTEYFDAHMIQSVGNSFAHLLADLPVSEQLPLTQLSFIQPGEMENILQLSRGPEKNRNGLSFPVMWKNMVRAYPGNVAVSIATGRFTYSEINETAEQLAAALAPLKELYGNRIALLLPRSEKMIAAMLGSMLAGVTYIPLDPSFPERRIVDICNDAQCRMLLTAGGTTALLPEHSGIRLLEMESLPAQCTAKYEPCAIAPEDSCYIIYTSGSTGAPKGVMIPHAAMADYICSFQEYFQVSSRDVVLQQASLSFDTSVEEIFPVLGAGGRLHILEDRKDLIGLLDALGKEHISILSTNPFVINLLNDSTLPSSLRVLISGGDVLNAASIQHLLQQGIPVYNTYGPTESTVCATYYHVKSTDRIMPIGSPITNREVYILDKYQQVLPLGVEGEICLGGEGLATGYVNNIAATEEKFIPHPFAAGRRLYRTGDSGILRPDGNILFTGRIDDQIKFRGYRIEAGEIEKAIAGQPIVKNCAVTVKEVGATPVLAAYIVYKNGQQYGREKWQELLKDQLPAYMIPEVWMPLNELPMTVSGKIDKKQLPVIQAHNLRTTTHPKEKPASAMEMRIAEIWKSILGLEDIGRNDIFFEIGGHSLNVMQLANYYYRTFEIKVSLQELFQHTTIASQAGLIAGKATIRYTKIERVPDAEDYKVSDGQRRLWVVSQLDEASKAYHLSGALELRGSYHPASFNLAIRHVIARHEILRTIFRENKEGELRQVVLPVENPGFELDYKDMRGAPRQSVQLYMQEEALRRFDLAEGPLLRAGLIRLNESEYTFHYTVHHIISDGWSMELLKDEVLAAYRAVENNMLPDMPALRMQYRDYAVWQQEQLHTERFNIHRAYWQEQLGGELPVLELPTDKTRPAMPTYNGYTISTLIGKHEVNALYDLCLQQQCTLFIGLVAVLKLLCYRYTGQEDIIVGTPVAGRDHTDLEDQIGFYINVLALRTQFSGNNSFSDLLKNIRKVMLNAYTHQAYPFDRLVEELGLQKNMSRSAVFNVMVVLQNQQQKALADTPADMAPLIIEEKTCFSKFDLTVEFVERTDGLRMNVQFNSDIYDRESIIRFVSHYKNLLTAAASFKDLPVSSLNYLSIEEQGQLLYGFNQTSVAYPAGVSLVNLFRQQVKLQPHNTALCFRDRSFSYEEIDKLSNQLACYLTAQYTLAPDDLVMVMLPRSEWLIISLLAVLKAGAAYVPVDVAYPQGRINFIMEDSGSKICINEALLDAFNRNRHDYSTTDTGFQPGENNLAYVIYTSGSTGNPKGCMLEHAGVVNRLEWMWREYNFSSSDVILQKTTFTFDVSVWEIFLPLCWGCKMVLCEDEDVYAPDRIAALISKHQVTCVHFVPSMLSAFIADIFAADDKKGLPGSLKRVITSGEALQPKTLELWYEALDTPVYNLYGPTEASIDVSHYNTALNPNRVLIGKPVANTYLYILDPFLQLVPPGVTGELYIGGVQLARGYLNREQLTAEKFIDDPYNTGKRLYRTGDLCRWTPDGNIEYLGRIDDQVKIRGYRIELKEVEQALCALEGVSTAVVTVGGNNNGERYLAAYVVSPAGHQPATLKQQLLERLPAYMVPSCFMMLDKLPVTANGKVDKRALPDPSSTSLAGESHVPPRTETEIALAGIYEGSLNRPGISVTDNFFDLGITSLLLIKIRAAIRKQFGLQLNVHELYKTATIEELAATIDSLLWLKESTNNNIQQFEEFTI